MRANLLKDKSFMKNMLKLALPISLQSLIQSSLGLIDQIMIGQLGEKTVAGVGLGSRIPFIFFMVIAGITSGTSIYASQYWGKKDTESIGQAISTTLAVGVAAVILFAGLSLFSPNQVVGMFSKDTEVIVQGALYLKIVSISFLPVLITMTYSAVLRSTHHVKLPLYAGLISVAVNTVLNYVFIFGAFGVPAFGISGAAVATAISKTIECLIILGVIVTKKLPGCMPVYKLFALRLNFFKVFMVTTLPLLINEFFWSLGESIYAGIFGRMGTEEATGMIITYPLQGLFISIFVGISSAAGVMLGNKLGETDYEAAYDYAKRFMLLGVIGAVITGGAVIGLSSFYVSAYNVSKTVSHYAVLLTTVFGMVLCVKVGNMVAGGILRSGGQTKLTLFIDLLGTWGIGIPIGIIAAFVLRLPVYTVYILISLEEVVRIVIGLLCIKRKSWIKNIVNETAKAA